MGASKHTLRAYRADLTQLHSWLEQGNESVAGLDLDTWEGLEAGAAQFLNERRDVQQAATVTRKLGTFRGFAGHHGRTGFLTRYRKPSRARPKPHPLPEGMAGIFRLLEVARSPQEEALIGLCGLAGLRVGEACGVRPVDILVKELLIRVYNGKGYKTRYVPMTAECWFAVQAAWTVATAEKRRTLVGMNEDAARHLITRLGRAAGLSRPVASHDLRATLATESYKLTHDIRAVQEILGHSNLEDTMVYTEVGYGEMRQAMEHPREDGDEEEAS